MLTSLKLKCKSRNSEAAPHQKYILSYLLPASRSKQVSIHHKLLILFCTIFKIDLYVTLKVTYDVLEPIIQPYILIRQAYFLEDVSSKFVSKVTIRPPFGELILTCRLGRRELESLPKNRVPLLYQDIKQSETTACDLSSPPTNHIAFPYP